MDGDDYGDTAVSLPIVAGTDCNDTDGATFPGAPQACDGNDNTCGGGGVPTDEIDLGPFALKKGQNRLTVEIVGANEKAAKAYMFGLDYLLLK